ncbi:hypothetical protein D1007_00180 [Hordeum vulgare]|nr:hypothetical protein D1007_00180 [Hordeum vulgare]
MVALQAALTDSRPNARGGVVPCASPRLITKEDRCIQQRRDRRLLVVETAEKAMDAWHEYSPQDVIDERKFWTRQRALRATERCEQMAAACAQCDLGAASTWSDNDERYDDAFVTSDYTTE